MFQQLFYRDRLEGLLPRWTRAFPACWQTGKPMTGSSPEADKKTILVPDLAIREVKELILLAK
ncbi:MAG: hypothetical protein A2365_03195 [Candidatus Nealsonbacteria bacterium RIFOXYB1_FULL_40_15]|uniref:Uncharacterized protein n=2 Tax=Candidatus Nealsoniibacteriota TaxID=1817911 RepID=A0A1G2EV47_9BACT|nr:MAG: hypothetical protein A2365_03195 [Candidatus Nealsonbacteria bacterium RIFOXYB1_FULL_40_15]OGZ29231.1 MAG: hypothetical protein A2427_03055 [Candidatus Nealsonbacteria bacterium RIFOXYC1_FULL_40_7]OGZ29588.1 MAG: hypothetical protein A2562_03075 [Candidatus Nealsonbacteria bacterium RIFOXYD1_FULL_39_11]